MLELLYIKSLECYGIKYNNKGYSMQDAMNAHIKTKKYVFYGLYNGEKSNSIYLNDKMVASIEVIYSNLIDKTTHKRKIKDIKIHLLK